MNDTPERVTSKTAHAVILSLFLQWSVSYVVPNLDMQAT